MAQRFRRWLRKTTDKAAKSGTKAATSKSGNKGKIDPAEDAGF